MDALIIKREWLELIFAGKKSWELRGCNTTKRGRILLIESGSKHIVGECCLDNSVSVDLKTLKQNEDKHQVKNLYKTPYKNTFSWVISRPQKYEKPIPYKHPNGAIIWVKIKE